MISPTTANYQSAPASHAPAALPIAFRDLAIPSASEPGTKHAVRLFSNGGSLCDCRAYVFHGKCSHITQAWILVAPVNPWPSFCHCVRCQAVYPFSEASPLFCAACRS